MAALGVPGNAPTWRLGPETGLRVTRDGDDAILGTTDYDLSVEVRLTGAATGGSDELRLVYRDFEAAMKATVKGDSKKITDTHQVSVSTKGDLTFMDLAGFSVPIPTREEELPDRRSPGVAFLAVPREALASALTRVASAVRPSTASPVLAAVHFSAEKGKVTLTGTDRYRLARDVFQAKVDHPGEMLVPLRLAEMILKFLRSDTITIYRNAAEQTIAFSDGTYVLSAQEGEGTYLEIAHLFENGSDPTAVVNADELRRVIVKSAALAGTRGRSALVGEADGLRVLTVRSDAASDEKGIQGPVVKGVVSPEWTRPAASGDYLLSALDAFPRGATVTLGQRGSMLRLQSEDPFDMLTYLVAAIREKTEQS